MRYQAIATILHQQDLHDSAIEMAIEAARRWGAHLHVLCVGINQAPTAFYRIGAQAVSLQEDFEQANLETVALEQKARARLSQTKIAWEVQAATVISTGLESFLADQMRFYDLIILPSLRRDGTDRIDASIFEACTFGADRPVMAAPNKKTALRFKKIQIAWDNGGESLAASRAALPLLRSATYTEIVLIDPPRYSIDRSDPGGRLAQLLAHHGVKPEIFVVAKSEDGVAAQLLRHAKIRDIDLIVMGARGRSHMGRDMTSGVTRSMLEQTDVPLLLAH